MKKEDFDGKFRGLVGEALKDDVLTTREKEMIALACGIMARCEGCIEAHTKNCKEAGVSYEEIMEVTTVTTFMSGGPGMVYGMKAKAVADRLYGK